MRDRVEEFFSRSSEDGPRGHFHRSLQLTSPKDMDWNEVEQLVPDIPKGWYELMSLNPSDRIEFVSDFWSSKLDFFPHLPQAIEAFFRSLSSIEVFLAQKSPSTQYEGYLVYCLKNDEGFFWGNPPASEEELLHIQSLLDNIILPHDYLTFLTIHNGFAKSFDRGLIPSKCFETILKSFQENLANIDQPIVYKNQEIVSPQSLVPFYCSVSGGEYQCFFKDWYPTKEEMGNVCYSFFTYAISDCCKDGEEGELCMAFPTFSQWLIFYMECVV